MADRALRQELTALQIVNYSIVPVQLYQNPTGSLRFGIPYYKIFCRHAEHWRL